MCSSWRCLLKTAPQKFPGNSKLQNIFVFQGGDADTNCAVAGALLGCKLGVSKIPDSWLKGLCHKEWLDKQIAE